LIPSHLLHVGTIPVSVINPKPNEFPGKRISNSLPVIVKFSRPAGAA